jgi:hypothetical protein
MIKWMFLIGLALIFISIVGGGIEVKEIRIPTLPKLPRAFSLLLGLGLVLVSYKPTLLPASLVPPPVGSKQYAGALPIFYSADQSTFAGTLYDFLASKKYNLIPLENTLTNYSEILDSDHEKPGTIRVVYKSDLIQPAEKILVGQMRTQYPAEAARVVESLNGNAAVPLQVQLW